MRFSKYLLRVLSALICLTASMLSMQTTALAESGGELDDATCLSCHGESQRKIEVPDASAEMRPLHGIQQDRFAKSIHGEMTCIECHQEITDSKAQHQKSTIEKPNCITCHEEKWEMIKRQEMTIEKARMGVVVENISAYKQSLHALPTKSGEIMAFCDDCHDTHYFDVPPRGTSERTAWHLNIPKVCGSECHKDQLDEYQTSVHGQEALVKHNPEAAVCTDCHTAHEVSKTTRDPFQLSVTKKCGGCHQGEFDTYRATYHGQINSLGYVYTAKCYNCHASHKILGVNDPDSTIHPDNRLDTCQECHNGTSMAKATESFLSFGPHATTDDFEKYPQLWIAAKFMHGLLLFVFSYFWLHSLLWWFRECRDRCGVKTETHIRTKELLTDESSVGNKRQVRRFGLIWRIGHLVFALSVMILILTGMAVFYAYTDWAPVVIEFLGGPKTAGLIHRVSAATMLGIFFLHLIGVSINIYRHRKTFRWFGPDSLLPNWKDFWDVWGMFKWFVYRGPRPMFDRWTYWEKFDYWAVFWGMAIIGGSGMMLSFPEVTASIFPGWVFNVVMLIHGEEAFLTVVFLFTVHFFNNHFRPDKLPPPDVVMFTGTQSLEEFKREHTLQYERLVETGKLEEYLVDMPSRPMTLGSKILGIVLLTFGLSLLAVVAIGFMGGYTPD